MSWTPALGRTYAQIAAEGRSQHKTQEMGGALLHGPQSTRFAAGREHGRARGQGTVGVRRDRHVDSRAGRGWRVCLKARLPSPSPTWMPRRARRSTMWMCVNRPASCRRWRADSLRPRRREPPSHRSLRQRRQRPKPCSCSIARSGSSSRRCCTHPVCMSRHWRRPRRSCLPVEVSVSVRAFVPEASGAAIETLTLELPGWLDTDGTGRSPAVHRPRVHGALPARAADAAGLVHGDGVGRRHADAAVLARACSPGPHRECGRKPWRRLRVEGRWPDARAVRAARGNGPGAGDCRGCGDRPRRPRAVPHHRSGARRVAARAWRSCRRYRSTSRQAWTWLRWTASRRHGT